MNSGISTRLQHSGYNPKEENGAIIPPLYLSTAFTLGNQGGYEYSRSSNPTRKTLELVLAELDNANYAFAYSSGSAVLANVAALLRSGEEILFSSDAYGRTYRYAVEVLGRQGVRYPITDFTNPQEVEETLRKHPIKIVWVETPTNPLLKVADIATLSELAHEHGALLVVDNTFATPVIQRPLEFGTDIVVYSPLNI